ncbi:MAG TPA: DUF2304 domain-containing protein [Myxococcales bacterium]|nr:DUF2304 domain-containing protein [Myxococcales bacterium]
MNHPLLPLELQVLACGVLAAFLAWVLHLVRAQRLSLRDSLLWLLSTGAALVLTLFPALLQALARALAIEVPSNALFAAAILYLMLNVLSLTIALSGSASRTRRLAQECALLRAEVETLRGELAGVRDLQR